MNDRGYSGTPLPRKLGISAGALVALAGAPPDFATTLGPLPEDVRLRRGARGRCDVLVWFVRTRADLARAGASLARRTDFGRVWLAWRKQQRGVPSVVVEGDVRRAGLEAGLVDYKICAVDATWSGLCFTRRKPARDAGSRPATRRG